MSEARRDLQSGLLFFILGLATVYVATTTLELGTMRRMGSGYYPTIIGVTMSALGLVLAFSGLRNLKMDGVIDAPVAYRAVVLIGLAPVVFALTVRFCGLMPSSFLGVAIAALAYPGFRIREIVLLAASLSAFSALVFVVLLGLPLELVGYGLRNLILP